MKTTGAFALLACAALAGCSPEESADPRGEIRATVALTAATGVTRVSLTAAGNTQDLALDPQSGAFTGAIFVPAGPQTITAVAYAAETEVGSGSAAATITDHVVTDVLIRILDSTGPAPTPDHGPILTSLVIPTTVTEGQPASLSATAVDPDGEPLVFAWTSSCGGSFSTPTSATTEWTAPSAGACTITLTVSSGLLTDEGSVRVIAFAGGN